MDDPGQLPTIPLIVTATAAGLVSAGSLLAYSVFAPRCQFWAPVIRSLPQMDAVALTFDDGPHAEFTPLVLDILAELEVKATFFVIGRYARALPEIVRRIADEGHTIGNHTLDHDYFGVNKNRAYWDRQLGETQKIVAEIVGQGSKPILFRPPMGFKTWNIAAAAKAEKLPVIGWSVRGYDTRFMSSTDLRQRVVKRTTGHDIVMLHDGIDPVRAKKGGATQRPTVEALPGIIRGIREKNLTITPLIEALVAGAKDRDEVTRRTREKAAT